MSLLPVLRPWRSLLACRCPAAAAAAACCSHPVIEMGPGPVRLQAAVEAVVFASAMTPLFALGE
jgi:hypothetical protein